MNYHSLERLIHLPSSTPDGIKAIYANTAIRRLGLSVVGIFFPVFIFLQTKETFGDTTQVGLLGIVWYFSILQTIKLVTTLPVAKLINKIGFRKTILTGNVFLVLVLLLVTLAETYYSALFLAAIFHGLSTSFYWMSYHTLFATDGMGKKLGSEVSFTKLTERLSNIAGPAIGGLILTVWGFGALFVTALIIVLLSSFPFFYMKPHKHTEVFDIVSVRNWFFERKHLNEIIAKFGRHIDYNIAGVIFPIFAFMVLGTYSKQGLIQSLA